MILKWYLSLNVQRKITSPTIVLLSLSLVSIILLSLGTIWILAEQRDAGYFTQKSIAKTAHLEEAVLLARIHLRDYYIFKSNNLNQKSVESVEKFNSYAKKMTEAKNGYLKWLRDSNNASPEMLDLANQLSTTFDAFALVAIDIKEKIDNENMQLAAKLTGNDCHIAAEALLDTIASIQKDNFNYFETNVKLLENSEYILIAFTVFLTLVSIFLFKFILGLIRTSIIQPIKTIDDCAKDIANGKHIKIEAINQNDELSSLVTNFNKMSVSLADEKSRVDKINNERLSQQKVTTQEIEESKKILENDINAILSDLNRISQGDLERSIIHSQNSSIEQIVNSLNITIDSIASSLRKVDDSAKENIKKAKNGALIIDQVKSTTQEVVDLAKNMQTSVSNLQKVKEEISNIISVINAIAEQTNLLALNASIEAARAGEQGRGFAVVADEVRLLASKTVNATQDIANLISRLHEETESSVNHVEQVNAKLGDSDTLAMESDLTLKNIVQSSENIEITLSVFKGY